MSVGRKQPLIQCPGWLLPSRHKRLTPWFPGPRGPGRHAALHFITFSISGLGQRLSGFYHMNAYRRPRAWKRKWNGPIPNIKDCAVEGVLRLGCLSARARAPGVVNSRRVLVSTFLGLDDSASRPLETRNASLSLEITLQEKESQDAVLECAFRRPGSLSCNVILSEAFRKK